MIKTCKGCGREFKAKGNEKYCSYECHFNQFTCGQTKSHLAKPSGWMFHGTCEHCKKEFISKRERKYCSDECGYQHTLDAAKDNREQSKGFCKTCGIKLPLNRWIYCSDSCNPKCNRGKDKNLTEQKIKSRIAERYDHIEYVYSEVKSECEITVRCKVCGNEFKICERITRTTGNAECPICREHNREEKIKKGQETKEKQKALRELIAVLNHYIDTCNDLEHRTRTCEVCGRVYIAQRYLTGNKYCSDICRNKAARRWHHMYAKKRRVKYEGNKESICSEDLFKRNNGTCYLCGKQCLKNDYTIVDGSFIAGDRYPTIDHIVPLSKGGKHEWNNVGLACMKCNRKKSDQLLS